MTFTQRWVVGAAAAVALVGSPEAATAPPAAAAKSLICAGWHGLVTPTPDFIAGNFDFLESRPFDGLAVYLRDPGMTVNATIGVMTTTPISYEEIASILDPIRDLPFTTLKDNFAYVVGSTPPDFFDDWSVTLQNFRNLARALEEAGIRGILFDNEPYFIAWAFYPDGVAYPERSFAEYQAQAYVRGREVMEAMQSEFPDIVVVSLHGPYISEPYALQQMGFTEFPPYYLLLGPFFAGFLEGTSGDAECVDGGELYWFREAKDFADSYTLRRYGMASEAADSAFIPPSLRSAWPGRISIGYGLFDREFLGEEMTPPIMTSTLKNALGRSDRWVWLYTEDRTFLTPESAGGATQVWVDAVAAGRIPPAPPPASNEESSSCGLLGAEAALLFLCFRWIQRKRGRSTILASARYGRAQPAGR